MTTSTATNIAATGIVAALLLGACSNGPPPPPPASSPTSADSRPLGVSTTRPADSDTLTVDGVIRALNHAGLAAPYPVDTTAQECRVVRCRESVVTDTVRLKSFATPAEAARYAIARGAKHIGTLTVAFPPPMPPIERQNFWSVITRLAP